MTTTDTPARDELSGDDDELDGCGVDLSQGAIADEEILAVVLGDDPARWEEYRKLRVLAEEDPDLFAKLQELNGAPPAVDR